MLLIRGLLLITLILPIAAQAQEREQLRTNAISVLHSLAQSANEIDDIAERVRVLAEIGDAFWTVEPEHARNVLVRAFKEIDKLSASATDNNAERLAMQKRTLRRIVLARIARREPSLAGQLVHDLPNEVPTADEKAMQRQGVPTPNAEALLASAEGLIASDPKRAAATATYSLRDGLSQRLRHFLIRLRSRDAAAADALVAAAVQEASAQHPARLFDVMVLWDYVYQPPDFYFNGIVWDREGEQKRQNTSQQLRRMVLAFAVNAIVENLQQVTMDAQSGGERSFTQANLASLYSVIQQLLPTMQADWPRGTADLQQALVRVEQELKTMGQAAPTRPPAADSESNTTAADSLLERAAAAPQGDLRDSLYLAAASKLMDLRQYERARDVAAKIDDAERRTMILEPLNFRMAGDLVEKKKLPEALSIANEIKTPELRIGTLARVGRAFTDAGDSQSGLQALNAAQSLANKTDPSIELAAATLRLATAFAKNDPIRLNETLTLAIQTANKTKQAETPWSLLSSASAEDALSLSFKHAEGGGLRSIKVGYPRNGGLADLLAKLDFNQAIALARTVNRKALSLAAQAAICRAAIESTQTRSITARSN